MHFIGNQKTRRTVLQFIFVGGLLALLASAVLVGRANLAEQGITSGFAFLDRATGYDISFSLIEFSPNDTFARLLWAGIINTIFLGVVGIVLANIVGIVVAMMRISSNAALNAAGTLYIEIFRNVPMILQAFFFYAVLTHLPRPKQAYSLLDLAYFSSRGMYFPGLNVTGASAAIAMVVMLIGLLGMVWFSMNRRYRAVPKPRRRAIQWTIVFASTSVAIAAVWIGRIDGMDLLSLPRLKGLNFRDGIRVPPELAAMAITMGIYGGGYLAEIFRAGFLAVGKGQVEAAHSLGLSPWYVFTRIHMPLAIRAVLPTLINQYVWLFKATTLGIAIGFSDFFMVVSISITQAGQTLELIGILMLGFWIMNNALAFILNRVNKKIALKGSQLRS